MGTGALLLLLGALAYAASFFALRYAAARRFGAASTRAVLWVDRPAWAAVPFVHRALFVLAGPLGCYLCAVFFFAMGLVVAGRDRPDERSMRVRVYVPSPATEAGFLDGDRVLSVNGAPVSDWGQLRDLIGRHPREAIAVAVQRNDGEIVLHPTPGSDGKIGVGPALEHQDVGVGSALIEGLIEPPKIWAAVAGGLRTVLFGGGEPVEAIGPVGVAYLTGKAAARGYGLALTILGVVMGYFMWIPTLVALALFPRRVRTSATDRS